jgi:hypothetical protein
MLYRSGPRIPWQVLATDLAGADVYSALIAGPGDYALTRKPFPPPAGAGHRTGGAGVPVGLVTGIVLVLLILATVLIVRALRVRRGP